MPQKVQKTFIFSPFPAQNQVSFVARIYTPA